MSGSEDLSLLSGSKVQESTFSKIFRTVWNKKSFTRSKFRLDPLKRKREHKFHASTSESRYCTSSCKMVHGLMNVQKVVHGHDIEISVPEVFSISTEIGWDWLIGSCCHGQAWNCCKHQSVWINIPNYFRGSIHWLVAVCRISCINESHWMFIVNDTLARNDLLAAYSTILSRIFMNLLNFLPLLSASPIIY